MFHLTKNMFDAVPISMAFIFEIETMLATSPLKWRRAINEKYRVI
jgi:hypothetical protein